MDFQSAGRRRPERSFVFWDAHGWEAAEGVLCRLMPAIAARDHIVACHDVTDSRYVQVPRSYDGRFFWRGPATKEISARYNIGWLNTQEPQFLPLMDFLWRNDCEMRSADEDLAVWRRTHGERQAELERAIGADVFRARLPLDLFLAERCDGLAGVSGADGAPATDGAAARRATRTPHHRAAGAVTPVTLAANQGPHQLESTTMPSLTNRTYKLAVIAGDGIGKEVVPEGLRVLEAAAAKFKFDLQARHLRLRLCRLLPQAQGDDAGGLEAADRQPRRDLLRRRRLAGGRAGPHLAMGFADPVPP